MRLGWLSVPWFHLPQTGHLYSFQNRHLRLPPPNEDLMWTQMVHIWHDHDHRKHLTLASFPVTPQKRPQAGPKAELSQMEMTAPPTPPHRMDLKLQGKGKGCSLYTYCFCGYESFEAKASDSLSWGHLGDFHTGKWTTGNKGSSIALFSLLSDNSWVPPTAIMWSLRLPAWWKHRALHWGQGSSVSTDSIKEQKYFLNHTCTEFT